ncbi:MAG TPA: sigma-70 family RNA polymerase sigma factor [Lacipirellulaceae bacterium]|jgi:RNA polymerase sigma-70 factor (ECF subfamily)
MHLPTRDEKEAAYNEWLVVRCQQGHEEAFEELVSRWEARLFYYIRRLTPTEEDAWDVLQKVWLAVVSGIKSLQDGRLLPVWLYRVARNSAASHFRAGRTDRESRDYAEDLTDIEQPDQDFTSEDAEQVHHALDKLALPFREVLTLFFLEGLSVAEIARIVDIPEGTVKSRLHHAKRALRSALSKGAMS